VRNSGSCRREISFAGKRSLRFRRRGMGFALCLCNTKAKLAIKANINEKEQL
jgi:hypothetical protein